MTTLARLVLPERILLGGGARHELPAELARLGARRVVVVSDPGVVALGVVAPLVESLRTAGVAAEVCDAVQPDPTVGNVESIVEVGRGMQAEALVAIGGGSPLDAAKAAAIRLVHPGPLADYRGYHRLPGKGLPVVAVPTTAGTGAEVTQVAVITDSETRVKMMLFDPHLVPRVALVDYELSLSMPPRLTAAVGVDTLTHGIEAYVSRRAHSLTDPLALATVSAVGRYLVRAYRDPRDLEARAGMMGAACQGGMAFANASVALVHGMSRPLGAVYHLPHGLSNAVLLPTVTRFSLAAATARYADVARALGCASSSDDDARAGASLVNALEELNRELAIPRLGECLGMERGGFEASLEKLAADALDSGSPQNNPRVPTTAEIVALYRQAW